MNFSALAKKAGKTPKAFAEANIHTDSEVGKLARLWYAAQGTHGMGNSKMDGSGDMRTLGQKLYQVG